MIVVECADVVVENGTTVALRSARAVVAVMAAASGRLRNIARQRRRSAARTGSTLHSLQEGAAGSVAVCQRVIVRWPGSGLVTTGGSCFGPLTDA